jgi:integrase
MEEYLDVRDLWRAGKTLSEIARLTGRDRKTLRRLVRDQAPGPRAPRVVSSKLDPFRDYLLQRLLQDRKLRQYISRDRPATRITALFVTEHGRAGEEPRPLSRNAVELLIRRLGRRAGVDGNRVSPHTFRHTFATRAVSAGMDPIRLQRVLGHTTLTMVSRYVHFGKSDLLRGWDRYFET